MQHAPSKSTLFSALFLVAGTCIGGGMLALPVVAGIGGFLPSLVWLFVSWLAMTATSLLFVEASLWMAEGEHIISMASKLLGKWGKAISWLLYLFICYASLVGYAAGGGSLFSAFIDTLFNVSFTKEEACVLFTVCSVAIVYLGTLILGRVNAIFFMAMIAAYILLVVIGLEEVSGIKLQGQSWLTSALALPVLLTSFSHQTMVPSLTSYLKRNAKYLRLAIIGGTSLSFLVYGIWLILILGIVPTAGENGLLMAYEKGTPATQFLEEHVVGKFVVPLANFFSFFAIVTSFFGIALGLYDFLSDGLKIKEKGWGKVVLALLLIVPTLFFALKYERAFLVALETTGGIGDAVLNGIIPVMMVWVGRYYRNYKSEWKIPGGRPTLALLGLFFAAMFIWEVILLVTPMTHMLIEQAFKS